MRAKKIYTYCIFAAFFLCAIVYATQGAMLTSWIEHYNLEAAAQGAVGSLQSAGMTIALFVLIWQAGRVSKNTIVTVSLIMITALLLAVSFMPPFALLVALFCFIGICYGSISSLSSSVIADIYDGEDSSKNMSKLHGIFGIGGLVMPFVYRGLLNGGIYWNIAIRIIVILLAAVSVAFIILSRYSLKTVVLPQYSNQKIAREDLRLFFKRGPNILLILSVLFYGTHQSVIMVWIIRYVEVDLKSPALSALSLSLYWAGVTLTRLLIHRILHASPMKIVVFGNIVAAVAIASGVLSGSAIAVAVLMLVMGFANGTTVPSMISACCADNDCNTILPTNVMNISLYTAFFLCPLAVGALESYASLKEGMYMSALFAFLCGLMALLYLRNTRAALRPSSNC